ncbi:hypothetical protein Psi01_49730 [Planobispora siamensis]|uniref:Uncharacterized protein n=1 Tax=Planobispora siamensis TaxID=936338 RepID=A0A8J3SHC7_9ACTN|nr:hypothetical protein Psi01_49730 [Planobispora siamensis]
MKPDAAVPQPDTAVPEADAGDAESDATFVKPGSEAPEPGVRAPVMCPGPSPAVRCGGCRKGDACFDRSRPARAAQ